MLHILDYIVQNGLLVCSIFSLIIQYRQSRSCDKMIVVHTTIHHKEHSKRKRSKRKHLVN